MLPTTPCGPLRRRASSSLCHVATDKRGAQNWPPALAHTITEARHVSWAAQLKEWLNELYPEDNGLGILPNGTVGPDVDNSPVYTARIKRINGIGEYPIMYAVWCVADRIASLSDTTPALGTTRRLAPTTWLGTAVGRTSWAVPTRQPGAMPQTLLSCHVILWKYHRYFYPFKFGGWGKVGRRSEPAVGAPSIRCWRPACEATPPPPPPAAAPPAGAVIIAGQHLRWPWPDDRH